jgi:hypothetical protein
MAGTKARLTACHPSLREANSRRINPRAVLARDPTATTVIPTGFPCIVAGDGTVDRATICRAAGTGAANLRAATTEPATDYSTSEAAGIPPQLRSLSSPSIK